MPNDQSFDGRCPTCGQAYMGARLPVATALLEAIRATIAAALRDPSEPGRIGTWEAVCRIRDALRLAPTPAVENPTPDAVRPWGYYWVTTEEDDEGDEPSLAEWCCSDRQRNEGHWWFCGSGAYDDSPQVKAVLMGPLAPPRDLTVPPTGRIIPE